MLFMLTRLLGFCLGGGGFLSCWLPASSAMLRLTVLAVCIWGTLAQFQVMEFVNMVPRECCSCYTDCSCFLFFSEMQKASTFLDLRNAFSVI